jgi:hypothetical protein
MKKSNPRWLAVPHKELTPPETALVILAALDFSAWESQVLWVFARPPDRCNLVFPSLNQRFVPAKAQDA